MKEQFKEFMESSLGLELWSKGDVIYRSKKSGVEGLLDFIGQHGREHEGLIIFDKIVGQGVALLAAYLKAEEVYGITGSKLAAENLEKFKIKFYFEKTVDNILNKDKTDLCPLEKLSFDRSPEEFYRRLADK
ncbi:MAG: DUF1893 domain-containing protein [Candidatus Pacebacteria bacterium]|jgi:hypothetical protein|nr:DUF1893 domain-containing protein [Candidatus Paceibacterota bacterium]